MLCACPCKREFEPKRSNQIYFDGDCRKKDKNRRWPHVKGPVFAGVSGVASGCTKQAVLRVATALSEQGGSTPEGPQIVAPGEKTLMEFQTVDEAIRRERLLTSREVAEILGVSLGTLRSWRSKAWRRDLPFVKFPGPKGRARYRVRDLQNWLDKLGVTAKEAIDERRGGNI